MPASDGEKEESFDALEAKPVMCKFETSTAQLYTMYKPLAQRLSSH